MKTCACGCGQETAPTSLFRHGHNSRLRGVKAGGYIARHLPDHPSADANGRVMEHVFVAEQALGHQLPEDAEVHHVDSNRQNNANRNLVICQDRGYHALLHFRARIVRAGGNPNTQKICSGCKRVRDLSEFWFERRNISGRAPYCKDCARTKAAA